jgi:hypothetical protein
MVEGWWRVVEGAGVLPREDGGGSDGETPELAQKRRIPGRATTRR